MKYDIAKFKAQLFANERNISVYIAKSNLTEDCCLLFDKKQKPTPHFKIIETVIPCFDADKLIEKLSELSSVTPTEEGKE